MASAFICKRFGSGPGRRRGGGWWRLGKKTLILLVTQGQAGPLVLEKWDSFRGVFSLQFSSSSSFLSTRVHAYLSMYLKTLHTTTLCALAREFLLFSEPSHRQWNQAGYVCMFVRVWCDFCVCMCVGVCVWVFMCMHLHAFTQFANSFQICVQDQVLDESTDVCKRKTR